ncbi:MAG: hypothetical protein GF353_01765 [Candidatus Lokiarchaeota archaeon]|nr:hypothetical protein [Candidatus Lokiarchaeota archaeon]
MPNDKETSRKNFLLRLASSVILFLMGSLTVALTKDVTTVTLFVLQQFGIAIMVAAAVSIILEILQEKWKKEPEEISEFFTSRGIQLLTAVRQGDPRYHRWVLETSAQDIFFAGRSVLHRIQFDFEERNLPNLEKIFIRKLNEGSKIKILLCHPLWELIDNLARSENSTPEKIRNDLKTSFDIINKLWEKLKDDQERYRGEIEIRLYKELIQYAYHRIQSIDSEDIVMYVGMYFSRKQGCRSPLFEVFEKSIQREFEEHFANVFNSAESILFYPRMGDGKKFNDRTYHQVIQHLS